MTYNTPTHRQQNALFHSDQSCIDKSCELLCIILHPINVHQYKVASLIPRKDADNNYAAYPNTSYFNLLLQSIKRD